VFTISLIFSFERRQPFGFPHADKASAQNLVEMFRVQSFRKVFEGVGVRKIWKITLRERIDGPPEVFRTLYIIPKAAAVRHVKTLHDHCPQLPNPVIGNAPLFPRVGDF